MTMRNRQNRQYRAIGKLFFALYIVFLVYFLIFSERYGRDAGSVSYQYNLVPFREIHRFWVYRHEIGLLPAFTNLFGNILIFVPFGFFLPLASKFRNIITTTFCSFLLSLIVEMMQFIIKVGCFDIDDLILNTLGGLIGYFLFTRYHERRFKRPQRRKRT